ncbi:RNA methyltransferase [Aureococcus anophagefferens]|nr:RNA methyltransferase [Aureococcus anophagefferens]
MLLCVARSFRAPLRASPLRRSLARSAAPRRIDSTKNDFVKLCKTLHRRKGREQTNLVFLEGQRLVGDALAAGAAPRTVLVADGVDADGLPGDVVRAPLKVVAACCDTSTPQGVVAVVERPVVAVPPSPTFVLALDGVSDPGNVGALIRTAAAAGCDAVAVVGAACADPWSPKSLRAAMGATFRVPAYDAAPWAAGGACVAVGAEVGVSRELAELLDGDDAGFSRVYIPMHADVESLNAAVAGSAILLEARRQRAHNR